MDHVLYGAAILFFAISTVYDDIRHGVIRNRRIVQGFGVGLVVYLVILVSGPFQDSLGFLGRVVGGSHGGIAWFFMALVNTLIGLVAAVALWHFKVWAAGDAKLFTLYCFLIPPDLYRHTDVPLFPGIILLINIFTFAFLYLLVDACVGAVSKLRAFFKTVKMETRGDRLRQAPAALLRWLPLLLTTMAMFAGIRAIREAAREGIQTILHLSEFTLFLILFAAFKPLSAVVTRRAGAVVFSLIALAAIIYLAAAHGTGSLVDLLRPGAFAVLLLVFARVYEKIGNVKSAISIGELRPGMILAAETIQALKALEEKERQKARAGSGGGEGSGTGTGEADEEDEEGEEPGTEPIPKQVGDVTVDGITAEQVRYIRTRFNDDEKILVARTVPFSPILALGAIVTFFACRAVVTALIRGL
ncbi:MAG: hypothetical protein ABIJ56_15125 [Pseudomonadota bacterium]